MSGYAPGSLRMIPGADGMYSAINPRTGQSEPVFLDNETSHLYFRSDGSVPASADRAGAAKYSVGNGWGSKFDTFMGDFAVPAGLAAIGGAGALSALGAGAGAGMTAADAATLGGMTEGTALGTAAAETGGAAAGGTGGVLSGESGGGPMWDWLDNYSGSDTFSTNPSVGDLGGNIDPNTGFPIDGGGGSLMPPAVPETDPTFGGELTQTGPGQYEDLKGMDFAGGPPSSLWGPLANGARALFGGGGRAGAGGSRPGGGMSFGEAAFDSTPFLLSAALANRQRNDINPYLDRLNSLSDRFAGNESSYLKSLTDPYDMSTARGRGDLTMRLGDRGVLGSSFGGMDVGNFDYMRDVGRGNLVSQAINQSVGAQSQLTDQAIKGINTRNAGTNALLGAGLNASARLFSPQRDPFGVESILRMAG